MNPMISPMKCEKVLGMLGRSWNELNNPEYTFYSSGLNFLVLINFHTRKFNN